MKTPSSDLHELIRSLTPSEKRYFKLQSSLQTGDKAYINLFDTICSQEKFDDDELKKLLRKDAVLNYLPKAKHKLYELVLKTLRNFHTDASVSVEIKNSLLDLELLNKKGLFKQCKKLIRNIKKVIYEYEKYELLPYVLIWERYVLNENSEFEEQEEIIKEAESNLLVLENINEYTWLNAQMGLLGKKVGALRTKNDFREIEIFIKNPVMASEKMARSYRAKQFYYSIYCMYYFFKRDMANALIYAEKRIHLFETNPDELNHTKSQYIRAMFNRSVIQYHLLNTNYTDKLNRDFISSLKKLKTIQTESKLDEVFIFRMTGVVELAFRNHRGDFETGMLTVKKVIEGIDRFKNELSEYHLMILYRDIANIYFGLKKYKEAMKYLYMLLNQEQKSFGQDVYCFAKLLNLIIHFEMGNEAFLIKNIQSTYQFLLKKKRLYKFESAVLGFLKKIATGFIEKTELIAAFRELRTKLVKLEKDPFEKNAMEHLDMISWLTSKIENRSFAEVVREKHRMFIRKSKSGW